MKHMQLWRRRVTLDIVVRANNISEVDDLTENMISAAIQCGQDRGVYGDLESRAFVEFGDITPLIEKLSSESNQECHEDKNIITNSRT